MTNIARFLKDESGATAIEYGLIAACISVAIIAVVQGVGSKLNSTFTSVQNALKSAFEKSVKYERPRFAPGPSTFWFPLRPNLPFRFTLPLSFGD